MRVVDRGSQESLAREIGNLRTVAFAPAVPFTARQFSSYDRRSVDPAVATDEVIIGVLRIDPNRVVIDVLEALPQAVQRLAAEGLLLKGGGHRMAAGLSVAADQIAPAMARLSDLLGRQGGPLGVEDLAITGLLMPTGASLSLADREAVRGQELFPINGLGEFGGIRDAAPDAWGRRVIEARRKVPAPRRP